MGIIRGYDAGAVQTKFSKAMAADGMEFVGRYLTRGSDWRTLFRPEVDEHHRNGMAVVLIFQHMNNTPGYFTLDNAKRDLEAACRRYEELKCPDRLAIHFAVDTDVIPANEKAIIAYAEYVFEHRPKVENGGWKWYLGWYGDDRTIHRLVVERQLGELAYFANAPGWRESSIPDTWDFLQKAQRVHPCGAQIDDVEILEEEGQDHRSTLEHLGAWVPQIQQGVNA